MIGKQTAELVGPSEMLPADQLTLMALEQHVIQLKIEAEQLLGRIALAEQDLARSEIRAPVSGRVVALAVSGPNPVIAPGATVAEIATAEPRSLLDRLIDPLLRTLRS
jgi:multidrug resistance efflux pump